MSEINFFGFHEDSTIADVRRVFSYSNPLAEAICRKIPSIQERPDLLEVYKEYGKCDILICLYEILFKGLLNDAEYEVYLSFRSVDAVCDGNPLLTRQWIQENAIDHMLTAEGWNELNAALSALSPDMPLWELRLVFAETLRSFAEDWKDRARRVWLIKEKRVSRLFTDALLTEADFAELPPIPPEVPFGAAQKLESRKALVFTGASGTGKTHQVQAYVRAMTADDASRRCCIQLHPGYGYADLVEGMRPAMVATDGGPPMPLQVRMDGMFKTFCREAVKREAEFRALCVKNDYAPRLRSRYSYYFLIDEIGCCPLRELLGEITDCLEARGRRVRTQLSGLPLYLPSVEGSAVPLRADVFAEGFYIPENLFLLGTAAAEPSDAVLCRRFARHEVRASDTMHLLPAELAVRAMALNVYIAETGRFFGLHDAHQLGQAYFRDYDCYASPAEFFREVLQPILSGYVRGQYGAEEFLAGAEEVFVE